MVDVHDEDRDGVMVVGDALDAGDIELLARMHVESLPGSLVSAIGNRYARAFYRYIAESPTEIVLLHRQGKALVGACIVSLEPSTMSRRLLRHTPLAFHAALAIRRLPLRAMLTAKRPVTKAPSGPEIVLIFTLPGVRSNGLGRRLLERCDAYLAERGHARLLVKTRDEASNRAIAFYERSGFARHSQVEQYGKRLVLFEKAIAREGAR